MTIERKKRHLITAMIIVIVAIAVIAFWTSQKPKDEKSQELTEAPAALVETMTIGEGVGQVAQLEKTITLSSMGNSADILAEYSGRLQTVNFEVGDYVKQGQVLAFFDQSNTANAPKVTFESTQRSLNLAQENLEKTKDVTEESIDLAKDAVDLAREELRQASDDDEEKILKEKLDIARNQEDQAEDSAKIQVNNAELQVEQSRNSFNQARIAYEKTIVRSPISGKVVSKSVNAHDYLSASQKIASVVGSGNLEAVIYLGQEEISKVKQGDSVEIRIGDQSYAGTLASFSSIANDANGRYEVRVRTDEDLSSQANRTAEVMLKLYLNQGFFLPLEAVSIGQQRKEVFVLENGQAALREVKTGEIIGTQVEITEGLHSGDQVIVKNNRNLQVGQKVRTEK